MAINRYDNPAEAKFLNTYVPIPFEQLYTIGKEAKLSVDQALAQQDEAMAKWSEYKSPSAVDTNTWYNETIGKAKSIVEEMAANPDLIKTAEGRARLQSTIRNVDREKLSTLLQSRDNMLSRQKVNQELMIRGAYDPDWHGVDFLNYDSSKTGTFNDVSPLAYKSIQDLTDPYYKGIQDSFIESKGGYDYTGVTKDMIANIADTNLSGIMNTPEAQKHMDIYKQRTGASDDQAKEWLRERVIQDNLKYERVNREENKFALQRQALAARKKDEPTAVPSRSTTIIGDLGLKKMGLLANATGASVQDISSADPEKVSQAYKQVYDNAFSKSMKTGNMSYIKAIWDSSAVGIDKQDVINYYHPIDPEAGTVMLKDKHDTFPGKSMRYEQTNEIVPLTTDGIPVAEISKSFIANQSEDLLKQIGDTSERVPARDAESSAGWSDIQGTGFLSDLLGLSNKNMSSAKKASTKVVLENYGDVIDGLYKNVQSGYFNPTNRVVEYGISGGSVPLVRGKLVVSEDQIDTYLESQKEKYGDFSIGEIKNMLIKGIGKDHKHRVMTEYKDKVKIGDEESEGKYYILSAGLPMFTDPNRTVVYDQYNTKGMRGTSASADEYPGQVDTGYQNPSWF